VRRTVVNIGYIYRALSHQLIKHLIETPQISCAVSAHQEKVKDRAYREGHRNVSF